jgi:hypothetical protein
MRGQEDQRKANGTEKMSSQDFQDEQSMGRKQIDIMFPFLTGRRRCWGREPAYPALVPRLDWCGAQLIFDDISRYSVAKNKKCIHSRSLAKSASQLSLALESLFSTMTDF